MVDEGSPCRECRRKSTCWGAFSGHHIWSELMPVICVCCWMLLNCINIQSHPDSISISGVMSKLGVIGVIRRVSFVGTCCPSSHEWLELQQVLDQANIVVRSVGAGRWNCHYSGSIQWSGFCAAHFVSDKLFPICRTVCVINCYVINSMLFSFFT